MMETHGPIYAGKYLKAQRKEGLVQRFLRRMRERLDNSPRGRLLRAIQVIDARMDQWRMVEATPANVQIIKAAALARLDELARIRKVLAG